MKVLGVQQSYSVIHTHISVLFQILFPYRSLQSIEWCSLCYTVGPYQLSILYTVVCICGEGNGTPLQYFAWKIPWTEEPVRPQSMGSLELDTTEQLHLHFSLSCIGEGNGNPLQYSCLENPRNGGAWWAAVSGVAQSSDMTEACYSLLRQSLFHLAFVFLWNGFGHLYSVTNLCF